MRFVDGGRQPQAVAALLAASRASRERFLPLASTFFHEGDVDMLSATRVGFSGTMMPDHVPRIDGDGRGLQPVACTFR